MHAIRSTFFDIDTYMSFYIQNMASPMAEWVKNLPAMQERDTGDVDLIPGSGSSPGVGNSNPLQYSCLENPMDRGACWVTVHGVTKNQT